MGVGVMSDNWRPKPYNSEPPRWVPRWLTLRMTSLLLWPTLASYSLLYLIWPTIYRNWWDRIDDTVILGALPLSCHFLIQQQVQWGNQRLCRRHGTSRGIQQLWNRKVED